jgi:protease-4
MQKKTKENNFLWLILGIFVIAIFVLLFSSMPVGEGCIGVIEIEGSLITKDIPATIFSDEIKGSETIAEEIALANKRGEVKSILLLVDSPGGSVVASKQIYDAIAKSNKSTIAYINEIGASGGYYVSAGADYIIANPDAIVGSIGARATFVDLSRLFEKIGYNETVIKTGKMKDIGSASRPLTQEEIEVISSIINESFEQFKEDIIKKRKEKLDYNEFEKILDARILSGRQAKKIGLIDQLGTKKDAIRKAAELGGIKASNPMICKLSDQGKKGLFGGIFSESLNLLLKNIQKPELSYK